MITKMHSSCVPCATCRFAGHPKSITKLYFGRQSFTIFVTVHAVDKQYLRSFMVTRCNHTNTHGYVIIRMH